MAALRHPFIACSLLGPISVARAWRLVSRYVCDDVAGGSDRTTAACSVVMPGVFMVGSYKPMYLIGT